MYGGSENITLQVYHLKTGQTQTRQFSAVVAWDDGVGEGVDMFSVYSVRELDHF